MPNIVEITDLSAPELDVYARLTQAQLRNRLEPEKGIFIAESPKVIARALDAGYTPLSLLMERKQITGPAADILTRCGDAPVYTADRETLASLTGFELTRGVLCAFRRPLPRSVEEVCRNARRVAVLEGIVDSTNVWIASDVVLLKGTDIGDNCVIGAGCVIRGKVPAGSLVTRSGELLELKVCADGFLYNMVRAITGTVLYAAEGKFLPEDIPAILESRDRTLAGPTVPPGGLYLTRLWYEDERLNG